MQGASSRGRAPPGGLVPPGGSCQPLPPYPLQEGTPHQQHTDPTPPNSRFPDHLRTGKSGIYHNTYSPSVWPVHPLVMSSSPHPSSHTPIPPYPSPTPPGSSNSHLYHHPNLIPPPQLLHDTTLIQPQAHSPPQPFPLQQGGGPCPPTASAGHHPSSSPTPSPPHIPNLH